MQRFTPIVAAGLAACLTTLAPAGQFDRSRVPDDVDWVMHADVQGGIQSEFGQLVLDDLDDFQLQQKIDAVKSITGLNPLIDFRSMTAFGENYNERDAVAVVEMFGNTGKLEDIARLAEEYEQGGYAGHTIHSWVETKAGHQHRQNCGVVTSDREEQTLLVFCHDRQGVTEALDVIDGRSESLGSKTDGVFARRPGKGSVVFIAARELGKAAARKPEARWLANAETLLLDAGEQEGEVYLNAELTMVNPEQAENLVTGVRGMLAFVEMAAANREPNAPTPAVDLMQSLNMGVDGKTVTVRFRHDAADFHAALKQLRELKQHGPRGNQHDAGK
jgi:hypothetical protein